MSEQPPEPDNALTALSTVLNRVRPTVVVRRRVYEVAREQLAEAPALTHVAPSDLGEDDDDEDGPPSSVNVARALAALRGDELRRLEDILTADDEEEEDEASPPSVKQEPEPASTKSIPVGETISITELAKRMGVAPADLVTTLVAAGYFTTTTKSVLTRANATTAAWMFGWSVEAVAETPKPAKAAKKKK